MKPPTTKRCLTSSATLSVSELLILPDGKIFAHNLTPELADVLMKMDPADEAMSRRANRKTILKHELPN